MIGQQWAGQGGGVVVLVAPIVGEVLMHEELSTRDGMQTRVTIKTGEYLKIRAQSFEAALAQLPPGARVLGPGSGDAG